MGCIALVRYVLVLRFVSAGVVRYPDTAPPQPNHNNREVYEEIMCKLSIEPERPQMAI